MLVAVPVQSLAFYWFGLYRGIWRFASMPDLVRITKAVAVGTAIVLFIVFLYNRLELFPRSAIILYPMLLVAGLGTPRLFYRWFKDRRIGRTRTQLKRTLIVGGGRAGELLVRDVVSRGVYLPLGIVDDDPKKIGGDIQGIRIYGNTRKLDQLIPEFNIDCVLIAIPSASHELLRRVSEACIAQKVECRTLKNLTEINDQKDKALKLRDIQIEDLLDRDPVELNLTDVTELLTDRVVLVSGAGGSIGSELCRQIIRFNPRELILVEVSELNLFNVKQSLCALNLDVSVSYYLADVKNRKRMSGIFEGHRPDVVFHAAAYKHVTLVEENPAEGVANNVHGTRVIADLSVALGVERFVLVSTDKAVNPTNIMGITKRAAEIYCQSLNSQSDTKFMTTRFGNVLGSGGSVVPLFRSQIAEGGPVTVTHPEVTRYFMTISEATQLILQAAALGDGGEIFVLDMGKPLLIRHLAEQMIRLAGLEPGRDIEIRYTGLRSGEKLHESLFHEFENAIGTKHPKIWLADAQVAHYGVAANNTDAIVDMEFGPGSADLKSDLISVISMFDDNVDDAVVECFETADVVKLH